MKATNLRLAMLIVLILHYSLNAQEPTTFFKSGNLEMLMNRYDWHLLNPIELDDRYVTLAIYGGLGPSTQKEIAAIFSKEGDLMDTSRFQPYSDYDLNLKTFKKWGRDSLLYCGMTTSEVTNIYGAATYMLDKDAKLLWQLPVDSGFYNLFPIDDSIAIGYSAGTSAINENYIGTVNYKTGKIIWFKRLSEFQEFPFGLNSNLMSVYFSKKTKESFQLWINGSSSIYIDFDLSGQLKNISNFLLSSNPIGFSERFMFHDKRPNNLLLESSKVIIEKNFGDTIMYNWLVPEIDTTTIRTWAMYVHSGKIKSFSTYYKESRSIGVICEQDTLGNVIRAFELTDLLSSSFNPYWYYKPEEMIPTSDGGYFFIVSRGDPSRTLIMKTDSNFRVTNSDLGIYIGVEEPLMAEKNSNISLFPNPTTGTITIEGENIIQSLEIISLTGVEVYKASAINSNQIQLTLNLPAGFYIVKLEDVFGQSSTAKISLL